jgi:hypothetical protein
VGGGGVIALVNAQALREIIQQVIVK